MTHDRFVYWLAGFVEAVGEQDSPTPEQWQALKKRIEEEAAHQAAANLTSGTGTLFRPPPQFFGEKRDEKWTLGLLP